MLTSSLFLILFTIIFWYVIQKRTRKFTYWKNIGLETVPHDFIFGNLTKTLFGQKSLALITKEAYYHFKKLGQSSGGLYFGSIPIWIPVDPSLVKSILVKDFKHFADRGVIIDVEKDPLGGHIFNLNGKIWKTIRQNITPVFTSGKIKNMFSIVENHTDVFCKVIEACGENDLDMNALIESLGIDVIGHVAFGINCNTLKSENQEFYAESRKIFQPSMWNVLKLYLTDFSNPVNLIKLATSNKEMCSYFWNVVSDTVKYRKENNIIANDFLQLMMDLMDKDDEHALNLQQIVAQAFVFFIAAFETSAKSLNLILYELAKNKDLQRKVSDEINQEIANNGGKYSYNFIMNNKLLDMVMKEGLRKHPPVVYLNRECTEDYKIPDSEVIIRKGTWLIIPVLGFQTDPEYFPNPEVYDPFRFADENANIQPFTYFPFGDGPRNCIGNRFGYLQVKLALAKLLEKFEVSLSSKTAEPLKISSITNNLLLNYEGKIYFNVKKKN